MNDMVDVTITVEPEVAEALSQPGRREAAIRVLTRIVKTDDYADLLARSIAAIKAEAISNGITDEIVDAELAAWRAERRG